jgi:carboxypeptidase D
MHPFVLSGTLHGGTLLATYPFDSSQTPSNHGAVDDAIFQRLASGYSKLHPTMHYGRPSCPGLAVKDKFPQGIARGSTWKPKNSSMKDYNYMKRNCFEVSIYLGCCKFPYANTLQNFWTANKKPLIYYMYQVSESIFSAPPPPRFLFFWWRWF